MIHTYKKLIVWKKALDTVIEIYTLTEKFPNSEIYALSSQMRRAAVSIPSNIAEGRLRSTEKDFRKFLYIAYSSGGELETQIEIAKRLPGTRNLKYDTVEELLTEVMKMLYTMINNRKDVSKTKR